MVDAFLDWLTSVPPVALYGVLAALSALENVFPPVPADVAVALGAFLSRQGLLSPWLLGLLCWSANTGTSAWLYFLARARGRALFERPWARRLVPPAAMAVLEQAYARHGVLGIFVSRFFPGVRAAVTPFAGVVGMRPLRALVPAASASAIWYAVLVAAGTALGNEWDRVRAIIEGSMQALGLIGAVATALALVWLVRRTRARADR